MFQYRKRYKGACNKARRVGWKCRASFQYRKRYKGACNEAERIAPAWVREFQYRKRYKGACNLNRIFTLLIDIASFNTVNGIRVHAIHLHLYKLGGIHLRFQYRKRYKGACNMKWFVSLIRLLWRFNTVNGIRVHAIVSLKARMIWQSGFQYRKRYKGACNKLSYKRLSNVSQVSIP